MVEKFQLPNIKDEKTVLKTVRLKVSTLEKLEKLSKNSDISINRLINECIEYAISNLDHSSLKGGSLWKQRSYCYY